MVLTTYYNTPNQNENADIRTQRSREKVSIISE